MENLGWLESYALGNEVKALDTGENPFKAASQIIGERTTGVVKENEQGIADVFVTTEPIAKYHKSARKPPHSIACLAAFALARASKGELTHSGIYAWIKASFPYYAQMPSNSAVAWKAKVRQVLIRNCSFKECDAPSTSRRSTLWTIQPKYRRELIQRLQQLGSTRRQQVKVHRRKSTRRYMARQQQQQQQQQQKLLKGLKQQQQQQYRQQEDEVTNAIEKESASLFYHVELSSSSVSDSYPSSLAISDDSNTPSPDRPLYSSSSSNYSSSLSLENSTADLTDDDDVIRSMASYLSQAASPLSDGKRMSCTSALTPSRLCASPLARLAIFPSSSASSYSREAKVDDEEDLWSMASFFSIDAWKSPNKRNSNSRNNNNSICNSPITNDCNGYKHAVHGLSIDESSNSSLSYSGIRSKIAHFQSPSKHVGKQKENVPNLDIGIPSTFAFQRLPLPQHCFSQQ